MGDLGANWTKPLASEHNLVIVNNQVGVDTEDSHNYAFWSADSFNEDQLPSQITITKMGSWPGAIVRADGVQDRFYLGLLVGAERLFGFMLGGMEIITCWRVAPRRHGRWAMC